MRIDGLEFELVKRAVDNLAFRESNTPSWGRLTTDSELERLIALQARLNGADDEDAAWVAAGKLLNAIE